MYKKFLGWMLIIVGGLCFLIVGGGSMRYRNRNIDYHNTINEALIDLGILIITPIVGYFLIELGLKILEKKN